MVEKSQRSGDLEETRRNDRFGYCRHNREVTLKDGGTVLLNMPSVIEGEYIWSYFTRIAQANGFMSTKDFLLTLRRCEGRLDNDNQLCSADNLGINSMMKAAGADAWIEEMTPAGFMRIADSQYMHASRVLSCTLPFGNPFSERMRSHLADSLMLCPVCAEEDRAQGRMHLHLIHQVPGLTVCPFHHVHLMHHNGRGDDLFDIASYRESNVQCIDECTYADAVLSLFSKHPETSLQDLGVALHSLDESTQKIVRLKCPELMTAVERHSMLDFRLVLKALISAVEDVGGLLESAKTDNGELRSLLLESIRDRFSMTGPFSSSLVEVECKVCGFRFEATPQMMIAGFGCPSCERYLRPCERLAGMVLESNLGMEWRLLGEVSTLSSLTMAQNMRTGVVRTFPLWTFLFHRTLPRALTERWSQPERPMVQIEIMEARDRRVNAFLANHPDYELVGIDGCYSEVRLTLRHRKCGEVFEVYETNFRASPYCRRCEGRGRYDEDDVRSRISKASNGMFSWCGSLTPGNIVWKATDGSKEIRAIGLPALLEKVERISKNGWEKRNLDDAHEAIETAIEFMRGRVIFREDLLDVCPDRIVLGNHISKLKMAGILESPARCIYWHTGEIHEADEVIERMFGDRYGRRIGIPVCDSLLHHIGAMTVPTLPAYAIFKPGYRRMDSWRLMGTEMRILYLPEPVSSYDGVALAFAMSIIHHALVTDWDSSMEAALVSWAHGQGLTGDRMVKLEGLFPIRQLRRCMRLLDKEAA